MNWDELRENYPLVARGGYFNTAYFGALSRSTVEAQTNYLQKIHQNGSLYHDEWTENTALIKQQARELTHAYNYSIGLGTDVSTTINLIADTFTGKEKIILLDGDFSALNAPWIIRNFTIDWVPRDGFGYDLKKIKQGLEDGAGIVAVSWVMYNSGLVLDLKSLSEMCESYGATLIVDATQGLGVVPIDLSQLKIDLLVASTFKWFLSGHGIALTFLHNKFFEDNGLNVAGQNTIISDHVDVKDVSNYKTGAERFELGHIKSQQIVSLKSSFVELTAIGFEKIQNRTMHLVQFLISRLTSLGMEILTPQPVQSGIFIIKAKESVFNKLKTQGITCTYRNGNIRFALYFYNNEEDIDQLIGTLS